MRRWLSSWWPWIVAALVAVGVLAYTYARVQVLNWGMFTYGLDDAYIHLQVARNLVEHGTWGINPGEFVGVTSSLLWPLLLAVFRLITGNYLYGPLVLSMAATVGLLAVANAWMARYSINATWRLVALLATLLATPWVFMATNGMEHVLQALLAMCLVFLVAEHAKPHGWRLVAILGVSILLVGTRFEGMILIGVVVTMYLLRRQLWVAVTIALAALAPIIIFGFVSVSNGGYLLPNSVLIKSVLLGSSSIGGLQNINVIHGLLNSGVLSILFFAVVVTIPWQQLFRSHWSSIRLFDVASILFLATAALQWQGVYSLGRMSRYIFYLVPLGIVLVTIKLAAIKPRRRYWVGVILLCGMVVTSYIIEPLPPHLAAQASYETYAQQYQTARFLGQYYPKAAVAVNDIGAVSYFGRAYTLDLVGLGSNEVTLSYLSGRPTTALYATEAERREVVVAALYPSWFGDGRMVPVDWVWVGEWSIITPTAVVGSPTLAWYAVRPDEAAQLRRNLLEFASTLPPDVLTNVQ